LGSARSYTCRTCGEAFTIRTGGGFFFDLLDCDRDGQERAVSHEEMGDAHLGFVKGLPGPYAVSRWKLDQRIKETYAGPALDQDEYHAAVEAQLEACPCGGHYRYDAAPRCPRCASTSESWDADSRFGGALYD
jgi:hypothetical protein